MFKDPRMKGVESDQPGFSDLKRKTRKKSEKRSQVKRGGRRKGKKS
jgi:hypothetical protein